MFGTIRRHKTWLWLIIIAATIVSFVAFFTPTDQGSAGRAARDEYVSPQNGKIVLLNGRPIKRRQFIDSYQEARLRFGLGLIGVHEYRGQDAMAVAVMIALGVEIGFDALSCGAAGGASEVAARKQRCRLLQPDLASGHR